MAQTQTKEALMIPLVIGVTGHRDLVADEVTVLEQGVREFLQFLAARFPDLPLHVISPMAEGADQLVAQVALEMDIGVTALLPMPLEMYRDDFEGDALATFDQLCTQCDVIELPVLNPTGELDRNRQYVEVGAYLAAHCHILLAIWDGNQARWPGGTSNVISFHQHDTMEIPGDDAYLSPINFTEDESDLVYHLPCSRRSSTNKLSPTQLGEPGWLTRDTIEPRTIDLPPRYDFVFARLAEFNDDIAANPCDSWGGLLPDEMLKRMPGCVQTVSDLYSQADFLARHYQTMMFRVINTGFLLILLAGASFITYADLFTNNSMLYAYLGLVATVVILFGVEKRSGWRRRYLEYRVLAEALRVQFYWSCAALKARKPHNYCHDSFHERRDLELGWIRHVMRHAGRKANNRAPATDEQIDSVIKHWVGNDTSGQRSYYLTKSLARKRSHTRARSMEIAAFAAVILIAVLLIFGTVSPSISNILIACVGLIPFAVAVRQNYAYQTTERELITQYSYYYRIFSNAERLITHTKQRNSQLSILRSLGEAALDESSQWILRQSERPISNTIIGA